MNILQVCNKTPYPPHDGGSLASYSLMRSFSRLGHQVTLLTMCTPKHNLSAADRDTLSSMVQLYTVDVDTDVRTGSFSKTLLFHIYRIMQKDSFSLPLKKNSDMFYSRHHLTLCSWKDFT